MPKPARFSTRDPNKKLECAFLETTNTTRATHVAAWHPQVDATAGKSWDSARFAHWTGPMSGARMRFRDTGELPEHPDWADDLLRWMVSNGGCEHIEAFMAADALKPEDKKVIKFLTLDGCRLDPSCMALLGECSSLTELRISKSMDATADDDLAMMKMACSHPPLRSLVVNPRRCDETALVALMQDLEQGRVPHLEELNVTYRGPDDSAWVPHLARYLEAAPACLKNIALGFTRKSSQDRAESQRQTVEILDGLSKGGALAPRTLKINVGTRIATAEGRVSARQSLARVIPGRCEDLESLDLSGISDLLDWSSFSQLAKLKELDVSMISEWGGSKSFASPNNRHVVQLIGESGKLASLAARGRCFDPATNADNPTPEELGAAIEATGLEKLHLEWCQFSTHQLAKILEAIPRNRSLTEVKLPFHECADETLEKIGAALARNKMDKRLGVAAGASLGNVFAGILPLEISETIADFALKDLSGSKYNAAARVMIGVKEPETSTQL